MHKSFSHGKNERLKSRKQIELLFRKGTHFSLASYKVYYSFVSSSLVPEHSLQFGVGVSNKNFKRAVDRNRIKRLLKEAWRLQKSELLEKLKTCNQQATVFFIYTGRALPDFESVHRHVALALKKLCNILDENSVTNS